MREGFADERLPDGWLERFDAFAGDFVARHDIPGAAVAMVRDGETVYLRAFGYRDREAGLAVTPATRFGIASLTKSFTVLALLALQEKGVLDLSDPVRRYLPGFAYPGLDALGEVLLWHMASHTSGIPPLRALDFAIHPSQVGDPAEAFQKRDYHDAPSVRTYDELLAYLRKGERAPLGAPGSYVSYSNDAYGLLGAVIERATGTPYADVMAEEVFTPLGMSSATFDTAAVYDAEAEGARGDATRLYTRAPDQSVILSPRWEEAPAHLATGFMKASVEDLAKALAFWTTTAQSERDAGGRAWLPAGIATDAWRSRAWAGPNVGYGLGWMIHHGVFDGVADGTLAGPTLVRHGGSLKGVSSHQGFVPELGLGVAVLSNLDEAPVKRLWHAAVNAAMGVPLERPPYPDQTATSVEALDPYAGVYGSGEPWGRLELRRVDPDDGAAPRLRAFTGEDAVDSGRLARLPNDEFLLVGDAGAWDGGRFHRDADGHVVAMQYGLRWYDRWEDAPDRKAPDVVKVPT